MPRRLYDTSQVPGETDILDALVIKRLLFFLSFLSIFVAGLGLWYSVSPSDALIGVIDASLIVVLGIAFLSVVFIMENRCWWCTLRALKRPSGQEWQRLLQLKKSLRNSPLSYREIAKQEEEIEGVMARLSLGMFREAGMIIDDESKQQLINDIRTQLDRSNTNLLERTLAEKELNSSDQATDTVRLSAR